MDKGLKAEEPQDIVDNLNPTENRETSEEAHGASNQAKLGLSCHLGEKLVMGDAQEPAFFSESIEKYIKLLKNNIVLILQRCGNFNHIVLCRP